MFLKIIKLAGFKSFVDPTTIPIKSFLNAIVGPNGCGKSNVVDAVRWVIGESSAKQLRTDSMADVVFNGSSARKPVGQASVELIFDNSDGKLGGEYAQYQEISIRRLVNREGISHYYLNGSACRRRDIIDLFLGTGLGPYNYAIIEQGMISRIIDAKPADMRIYFEEVSGISKYKERKRETEIRIRHAQENLQRLTDIRGELEKQLSHLKRQAQTAARYQTLKQEQQQLQGQCLGLQWREVDSQRQTLLQSISAALTTIEGHQAQQQHQALEILQLRTTVEDGITQYQKTEHALYEANTAVATLEERLRHHKETIQKSERELADAKTQCAELQQQNAHNTQEVEQLTAAISVAEPGIADALQTLQQVQIQERETAQQLRSWQQQWEQCGKTVHLANRCLDTAKTKEEYCAQQINQLQERSARLARSVDKTETQELQVNLQELANKVAQLHEQMQDWQVQWQAANTACQQSREQLKTARDQVEQSRREGVEQEKKITALQAIQDVALGRSNQVTQSWLQKQGLDHAPRMAEKLQVESGWENAVETVFGFYLEAICVEQLQDNWLSDLQTWKQGQLTLWSSQQTQMAVTAELGSNTAMACDNLPTLASKISGVNLLPGLDQVFCVADWQQAWSQRARLLAHQSFITAQGLWIGSNWVRVCKPQQETQGQILQRQQRLQTLQLETQAWQQTHQQCTENCLQQEQQLQTLEVQRDALQQQRQQLQTETTQWQTRHAAVESQCRSAVLREQQLHEELQICARELAAIEVQQAAAKQEMQDAQIALKQALAIQQNLQQQQAPAQSAWDAARLLQQEAERRHDQLVQTLANHKRQHQWLQQALLRETQRQQQLEIKQQQLQQYLTEQAPLLAEMQEQLQQFLQQRAHVEAELKSIRSLRDEQQNQLRIVETQHNQLLKIITQEQADIEKNRRQLEGIVVRQQNWEEQLQQLLQDAQPKVCNVSDHLESEDSAVSSALPQDITQDCNDIKQDSECDVDEKNSITLPEWSMQEWVAQLSAELTLEVCQKRLEEITQRLQRLGAVNLAAIEEYAQLSQRDQYLELQMTDLNEALQLLQEAMQKIDKETRAKLKETFDAVNVYFQQLFPQIFKGGRAWLEWEGGDVLEAGVVICAQPSGKRNISIHMLSGGEKALTAIALIFSMFSLNAAPFCMLDEVDAPLDDANVQRFCQLVKDMSLKTQFIIISHNKMTIEIAEQLIGVTMQEAGVSRIVAVGMDDALQMVESPDSKSTQRFDEKSKPQKSEKSVDDVSDSVTNQQLEAISA